MGSRARGFTLIELLVVMLIVGLVSIFVIPPVIHAYGERSIQSAATLVQSTLSTARDDSARYSAPYGVRFVPDPTLPGTSARLLPIGPASDYSEGLIDIYSPAVHTWTAGNPPPFSGKTGNAPYAWWPVRTFNPSFVSNGRPVHPQVITVVESPFDRDKILIDPPAENPWHPPTGWAWNVRVGDRLQIGTSKWYTVVGPYATTNDQGFVNSGSPNTPSPLTRVYPDGSIHPVEFLFLVNGQDDDGDGFADNGWDGVDNDLIAGIDNLDEWETEKFTASYTNANNSSLTYTIRRRPVPVGSPRGLDLPAGVVVDTKELPSEILLDATGAAVASGPYGIPSRFGLSAHEFRIHLIERGRADHEAWVVLNARTGAVSAEVQSP